MSKNNDITTTWIHGFFMNGWKECPKCGVNNSVEDMIELNIYKCGDCGAKLKYVHITKESIEKFKAKHPGARIVDYIKYIIKTNGRGATPNEELSKIYDSW